MALSNCPECQQAISSNAKSCPYCGYASKKLSGCSIIILFLVGLFFVMAIIGNFTQDEQLNTYVHTELDALRHAESKIKPLLKSPSTAEFPKYSERYEKVTGIYPEFNIYSWVDSQNGFGATIRTYYSCTVYYTVDDKVGLKDLIIDD